MAVYTAQQLADLRAAIATGALRVSTASMSTEFRSLADMQRLERIMTAAVEAPGGTGTARTSYGSYSSE